MFNALEVGDIFISEALLLVKYIHTSLSLGGGPGKEGTHSAGDLLVF